MRRAMLMLAVLAIAAPAFAQHETQMQEEFRHEREDLAQNCGHFSLGAVGSCAYTLATDNPLHVTFGTVAPQNGVGFGPALVGHHTPGENWRLSWSADAVATPRGNWRAGGYADFVHTNVQAPRPVFGDQAVGGTSGSGDAAYPVFSLYAQTISLDSLFFFGEGPSATDAGRSIWTMRQTIEGGSALVPVKSGRAGFALVGAITGRQIRVGGRSDGTTPAIDQRYTPAAVPGLGDDRGFLQLTGGVRLIPDFGIHVRPTYRVTVDRFLAGSSANESFTRWTVDLVHEFPFYRTERPRARAGNTPNDCSTAVDNHACPAPSRNRYGALTIRALTIGSHAGDTNVVPFYLQPTLGGADINGTTLLPSFEDYFYRAPNLLSLQATVEHSLFDVKVGRGITLPLGAFVTAEQGKVANTWDGLFSSLSHSYAAGLTLRAGGFPEVYLYIAWGHSTHHFSALVNPALLGGSSRPSLF